MREGLKMTQWVLSLIVCAVLLGSTQSANAEKAPDLFWVQFETTKGNVVLELNREWAPLGADQFYTAVKSGFYNDCRFFRVVPGFMVQFGINGDPKVQAKWRDKKLRDEPAKVSNKPGYITYAMGGPNSRTTQLFINYGDNAFLDRQGFAPFGKVISGMNIVNKIEHRYGERPNQGRIQGSGNQYLNQQFPNLDYIKKATILVKKPAMQAKPGSAKKY